MPRAEAGHRVKVRPGHDVVEEQLLRQCLLGAEPERGLLGRQPGGSEDCELLRAGRHVIGQYSGHVICLDQSEASITWQTRHC